MTRSSQPTAPSNAACAPARAGAANPGATPAAPAINGKAPRRSSPARAGLGRIDVAGASACVALTAAAYFALIAPMLTQHTNYQSASQTLDLKRQEAVQADASLGAVQRELDALNSRLTSSLVKLDPPADLNKRLNALTLLATQSGLSIERLEPGEARHAPLHTTVPLTISGSGPFAACVKFLESLRLDSRDTSAAFISLSSTSENQHADAAGKAVYVFELEWYAAPAASAGASADK